MSEAWFVLAGAAVGAASNPLTTFGLEWWRARQSERAGKEKARRDAVLALQSAVMQIVESAVSERSLSSHGASDKAYRDAQNGRLIAELTATQALALISTEALEEAMTTLDSATTRLIHADFKEWAKTQEELTTAGRFVVRLAGEQLQLDK